MVQKRQMILSAALMHGLGHQPGAWRVRKGPASDYVSPDMYAAIARKAEEGKLHVLFLAEQITNLEVGAQRPCGAMDTAAVLSYMAAVTSRIGLVGTASTTYNQPYDLARRFATVDHLSKGRVGWNAVTTAHAVAAEMFGPGHHPEAQERYSRADEFLEVVIKLWESWDQDALVDDKNNGVFADPEEDPSDLSLRRELLGSRAVAVPPLAAGPAGDLPRRLVSRGPRPGRAICRRGLHRPAHHRWREGVSPDLRRRAEGHGRHPDSIKILPGMNVILGETIEEAKRKKAALDNALTLDQSARGDGEDLRGQPRRSCATIWIGRSRLQNFRRTRN